MSQALKRTVVALSTTSGSLWRQSGARLSTDVPPNPVRRGRGIRKLLKWSAIVAALGVGAYCATEYASFVRKQKFKGAKKKKVVLLGSGWGALSVVRHLQPGQFEFTVVSPRNYFMFTPLLPSVTVGTVDGRSIVEPFRKLMLRRHSDTEMEFLEAECVDLLPKEKRIVCKDKSALVGKVSEFTLDYDILIVAVGAANNTFNTPGVEENCFFLKDIKDAYMIRNVIMDLVETAYIPGQPPEERQRLLHFVVVGGGPSGVEFAAELHDFMEEDVTKIYPRIKEEIKITMVQSQDHILNTYDKQISDYAEDMFKHDKINLLVNARVNKVGDELISITDNATKEKRELPYGMCVWATGVAPSPVTKTFMQRLGYAKEGKALVTDEFLRVKGAEGIFAIGDCSTIEHHTMYHKAKELFKEADKDGDGSLSIEEFSALMEAAKYKYPQVQFELSKAQNNCMKIFNESDKGGDKKLDLQEFKEALRRLDSKLKSLPATAQVADQEGRYVAKLLNETNGEITSTSVEKTEKGLKPFEYKHLGSFAYVGDNKAVLELPIVGPVSGWWTMWLWRAAYFSECASLRTRLLVAGDWAKAHVFGRDSSRV